MEYRAVPECEAQSTNVNAHIHVHAQSHYKRLANIIPYENKYRKCTSTRLNLVLDPGSQIHSQKIKKQKQHKYITARHYETCSGGVFRLGFFVV